MTQPLSGAGETKEELENSPFSEQLLEKGYEIIYFTDPVDEYVMQNLMEYDDYKFQSASKEDLKLGDKDAKKENKRLKASLRHTDLCTLLLTVSAEGKIRKIVTPNRLQALLSCMQKRKTCSEYLSQGRSHLPVSERCCIASTACLLG